MMANFQAWWKIYCIKWILVQKQNIDVMTVCCILYYDPNILILGNINKCMFFESYTILVIFNQSFWMKSTGIWRNTLTFHLLQISINTTVNNEYPLEFAAVHICWMFSNERIPWRSKIVFFNFFFPYTGGSKPVSSEG